MSSKIVNYKVRRTLYAFGATVSLLLIFYGKVSQTEAALWLALIPGVLNVLAAFKSADAVAVEDPDSPTQESAGEASLLPDGTPTITEPMPGYDPAAPTEEV